MMLPCRNQSTGYSFNSLFGYYSLLHYTTLYHISDGWYTGTVLYILVISFFLRTCIIVLLLSDMEFYIGINNYYTMVYTMNTL